MRFPVPSDEEKARVWDAYSRRSPIRTPLRWTVNPRIVLLDPALNTEGWTYEAYWEEPEVLTAVQLRFVEYIADTLSRTADLFAALPETLRFVVDNQNVYDAAYFGAPTRFEPGQVPATEPIYGIDDVPAFIESRMPDPLQNPWLRSRLEFRERLVRYVAGKEYHGRPTDVAPLMLGFDGPVTVAANLFGDDVFLLMGLDPDLARRLFEKITREVIRRNRALAELAGIPFPSEHGGLADDCIELISTRQYEEIVLPVHELWYSETSTADRASGRRHIHLCGDATRHFKVIHERLGVCSFDTGFPFDHGRLREELGDDVEISGGPPANLLQHGTPEQCAESARQVLTSGVRRGGRFILQEGNNLPPRTPVENLDAVYEVCLELGWYEKPS